MLYEMLIGRLPFSSTKQIDLLDEIRRRPPPPLRASDDSITPALEAICLKAWPRNPGHVLLRRPIWRVPSAIIAAPRKSVAHNDWGGRITLGDCRLDCFSYWHKPSVDIVDSTKVVAGRCRPQSPRRSRVNPHLDIRFQRAAEQVGHHRLEEVDLPLGKGDKCSARNAGQARLCLPLLVRCQASRSGFGRLIPRRSKPSRKYGSTEVEEPMADLARRGGTAGRRTCLDGGFRNTDSTGRVSTLEATVCQLPTVEAARTSLLTIEFPEIATDDVPRSIDGKAVTRLDPLSAEFEHALRERFHAYVGLVVTHN